MLNIESFRTWCWAIAKSEFSLCKIIFEFPLFIEFHVAPSIEIGIKPYWGIEVWIPYEVENHYKNRNNPDFVPVFYDDLPF